MQLTWRRTKALRSAEMPSIGRRSLGGLKDKKVRISICLLEGEVEILGSMAISKGEMQVKEASMETLVMGISLEGVLKVTMLAILGVGTKEVRKIERGTWSQEILT
jgi:hypothetical protein